MKYSKAYQHNDGLWYVLNGVQRFFINTASETEMEALEKAAMLSAKYYLQQANNALAKAGGQLIDSNLFHSVHCEVSQLKNKIEETRETFSDYDDMDHCHWA